MHTIIPPPPNQYTFSHLNDDHWSYTFSPTSYTPVTIWFLWLFFCSLFQLSDRSEVSCRQSNGQSWYSLSAGIHAFGFHSNKTLRSDILKEWRETETEKERQKLLIAPWFLSALTRRILEYRNHKPQQLSLCPTTTATTDEENKWISK